VLGSDGLWDLWAYKELLEYTFKAGLASTQSSVVTSLNLLVEETRKQSEYLFGEDADNICAIMVRFCNVAPAD